MCVPYPLETQQTVFARINFLLGLGILILIAFYFAGIYLLVLPLSILAPGWVGPAIGLAILTAVGVTVQLLSMAMSNLRGIALFENGARPGVLAVLGQALLGIGHIGTVYAASSMLPAGEPIARSWLLILATAYIAGIALSIYEWRQRTRVHT